MNYYGQARSNYFRVKDIEAFKIFCDDWYLNFITKVENNELVGFVAHNGLSTYNKHQDDKAFELDLSTHLKDDSVAVVYEIGSEGMRYFYAMAFAVNAKGKVKYINIDEIIYRARKLGNIETCVEY